MTRQDKYPETNTFHYFNASPHNRMGDDCVIRAICTALKQSWEVTVRELTEVGIKYGYVLNDKHTYEKYLQSKGWVKHSQPRKDDNKKYTGKEFCQLLNSRNTPINKYEDGSRIIAHIGGNHIVAIIDRKVNDIWNSTDGCIGNYWVKNTRYFEYIEWAKEKGEV